MSRAHLTRRDALFDGRLDSGHRGGVPSAFLGTQSAAPSTRASGSKR